MKKARLVTDQGTKIWVQKRRLLLSWTLPSWVWLPSQQVQRTLLNLQWDGHVLLMQSGTYTHCTWGPEREGRSQNRLRPLMRFMSQRYSCYYLLLCVQATTKKPKAFALYCKGAIIGEACDLKCVMGCTRKAEYRECKTAWITYVPGAKYVGCNLLHILTISVLWDNLMHPKIPTES